MDEVVERWDGKVTNRRVRLLLIRGPALKRGGSPWTVAISGAALCMVDFSEEASARVLYEAALAGFKIGDLKVVDRAFSSTPRTKFRDEEFVALPSVPEMAAFWSRNTLKGDAQAMSDPGWQKFKRTAEDLIKGPVSTTMNRHERRAQQARNRSR